MSERFPYRWALEVRKTTTADADRPPASVYSPRISQGGRTTHYAEEVLALDTVSLRDLPRRLRALANHYENVRGTTQSDDAVVLVGRRRALYVAEEELPSRTEQKVAVDLSVTSGSPTLSFSPGAGRWSFPTPTVEDVAQAETHLRSASLKTKVKKRRRRPSTKA